tara:strand:- start:46 stop:369 length:324 start_codon:yes stop_codon:yes gene_type:complete
MTKEQYLMMCEETGQEVDWEKCPVEWEDFPLPVLTAVNIYNSLGNRIYGDVGFVGKDFTNFNFLLQQYSVEKYLKDFTFEIVMFMEGRQIEQSQRKLKAELDRVKKK